ncbi:uncharacterized protein LOC115878944 isoform X2 [Sitophilus oryzae]|uniref:Uncharacterized protein LOC115878944 isoform X2 n=1 Tax=Sitophilus oryzae TaxID=7048 RepID=A0A6J2XJE6_SITOR|nr:uncharacterized protein LOC115878944 isoform X2 [Sitophilus oryzae]
MPKITTSNICANTIEVGTTDNNKTKDFIPSRSVSSSDNDLYLSSPASKRKKRNARENTEDMLLNIVKEPLPTFPPQPQLSPALMTVQSVLEKLPAGRRMKLELQFINKVYSEYAEFVETE